jgi:hypothetical protein
MDTKTKHLVLVQGKRKNSDTLSSDAPTVGYAVTRAIHAGFRIGQPIRIGDVDGCIVGYNIAQHGLFSGKDYPLLVHTRYGIAKCSLLEVAAA